MTEMFSNEPDKKSVKKEFTNGEWSPIITECSDWLLSVVISESEDRVICHTTADSKMSSEQQKANAHLISAAPDLFEACERALQVFDEENIYGQARLLIETSIRKALGFVS